MLKGKKEKHEKDRCANGGVYPETGLRLLRGVCLKLPDAKAVILRVVP
jgi:hypothetical protein